MYMTYKENINIFWGAVPQISIDGGGSVTRWIEDPPGPGSLTQPLPKVSLKVPGLVSRQNSRTGTQQSRWLTQVGKFIRAKCILERYETRQDRERAVCLGGWVSTFYWQLSTKGQNIHYLQWEIGFPTFFPNLVRGFLSWHPPYWACIVLNKERVKV